MKLAHSRLAESLGDSETSGPAPSRDSVAKHAADTGHRHSWISNRIAHPIRTELWFVILSTCCVLIPDLDGAVMGGRRHLGSATRRPREEHAGGRGLKVASVLHHFAAGLTQIPELNTADTVSGSVRQEQACTAELIRKFRTEGLEK